jgi:hypothetical protein
MSNKKTILILGFIFALTGLIMLAVAIYSICTTFKFYSKGLKAQGQVTELNRRGHGAYPTVQFYTKEGELITFYGKTASSPPSFSVGEHVEVVYNPNNPAQAVIHSFMEKWFVFIIGIIFTMGFLPIGLFLLIKPLLSRKKAQWLRQHGNQVETVFSSIEENGAIEINGIHPFIIVSERFDSVNNILYQYKSDNLWYNPQEYIKDNKITVFVNPTNPKKYWMDTRFLPNYIEY